MNELRIENVLRECGVTEATLSAAEKESLDRLGYVVLPDVIDAGWLFQLREAFERAVDQKQVATGGKQSGTRHASDLIPKDEAFDGVLTHPKILAAAYHALRRSLQSVGIGRTRSSARIRTAGAAHRLVSTRGAIRTVQRRHGDLAT